MMKLKIAIKVVAAYKSDKEKAEKNRTGFLWINPIFSLAYDGNYRTKIDGEEYRLGLVGFAEYPPKGYIVYNKDGEHVNVPCIWLE